MLRLFIGFAILVLAATSADGQNRDRGENGTLLGIVPEPAKEGVKIRYVLAKSPAERAGLQVGDVLTKIGETRITSTWDVDDSLKQSEPGDAVQIHYERTRRKGKAKATLISRREYQGDFLKPARRGAVGFEAPPWLAYEWANVGSREEPPTRESTKGKVVVFHCFQSW